MTSLLKRTCWRRPVFILCVGIGLGLLIGLRAGRFQASDDPLQKADAIFVFAGTRVERPLEGATLFREGFAPRIVITRAIEESGTREAMRRGVRLPSDFDLSTDLLRQLGVPSEAIIGPETIHDNTGDEVRTLRALATRLHWKRVILVSSKYHLRRIRIAATRHLQGSGIEVVLRGSRYDPATPDRWWQRRSDIRWLASEIPKTVAYTIGLGG